MAAVLAQAHLDPTIVIGGKLERAGLKCATWDKGDILVAEADESDGTFRPLESNYRGGHEHRSRTSWIFTVILRTRKAAYLDFINHIPFYGRAILCLDSVNIRALLPHVHKRFMTYGLGPDAELTARELAGALG